MTPNKPSAHLAHRIKARFAALPKPLRALDIALLLLAVWIVSLTAWSLAEKWLTCQSGALLFLNRSNSAVVGFFSQLFLLRIVIATLQTTNVRFGKAHIILLVFAFVLLAAFYAYRVSKSGRLYYWDNAYYYRQQLYLEKRFAAAMRSGLIQFLNTVWKSDYSAFINLFTEVPFVFTSRTADAYVICYAIALFPWLLVLYGALLVKMADRFAIKRGKLFFSLGLGAFVGFPLLHAAFWDGQPDLFGLIFVFMIVLLTVRYRFTQNDPERLLLLAIAAFALTISRRWYLFWLVAYFLLYGAYVLLSALREPNAAKRKATLLRIFGYAFCCALAFALLLYPMFRRMLSYDYATHYVSYLGGGFRSELSAQRQRLGWATTGFLLLGAVWGLIRRDTRGASFSALFCFFVPLLLFTRIQNMGLHQSLILVPSYLMLLNILFACVCSMENRSLRGVFGSLLGGMLIVNAVGSVLPSHRIRSLDAFSSVALYAARREDKAQIFALDSWLLSHCVDGKTAYMIPHSAEYNPSLFSTAVLPDQDLGAVLSYGSAIIGTHAFPVELFTATYVITLSPPTRVGAEFHYQQAFLEGGYIRRFRLVETIDMGNGSIFSIYERIEAADAAEARMYLTYLTKENALFPSLYEDEIEAYIATALSPKN